MSQDRRSFMKYAAASYGAFAAWVASAKTAAAQRTQVRIATDGVPLPVPYKRIATEEAWTTPEIMAEWRKLREQKPADEPGFLSLWGGIMDRGDGDPRGIIRRLLEMDKGRIADMDAAGIDVQLLLLTSPGVQVFSDHDKAVKLAADSNDQLAQHIRKHPDRYEGLAAIAPQNPKAAALELDRAVKRLGLKGAVINSHTKGEYLDDIKFWDIFEAAEALDVPIYIHPNTPPPGFIDVFLKRGYDHGIMGFGVETAFHTLAIITSGALDRFPKLKIVIGHAGEGLPYWMYRIDHFRAQARNRPPSIKELKLRPSDYMKRNLWVTTSGVAWAPPICMAQQVLGVDRVVYAMDYPFQYLIHEVPEVDSFPITLEEKRMLFQGNAERLFKLKPRPA